MTTDTSGTGVILALETSVDVCGVAVLVAGEPVAERTFRHRMHLSERLVSYVDGVLADADLALDAVNAFAVGIGPGSFTGTRIGVMTAKTLAAVLNRPVVGICSLEALAVAYKGVEDSVVVPMAPCRAGVVYTAAYRVSADKTDAIIAPDAVFVADLVTRLENLSVHSALYCGPASQRYRRELASANLRAAWGDALFPRASAVGALAAERLATSGPADDVLDLVPLYVSPPPITLPKPVAGLPGRSLPAGSPVSDV